MSIDDRFIIDNPFDKIINNIIHNSERKGKLTTFVDALLITIETLLKFYFLEFKNNQVTFLRKKILITLLCNPVEVKGVIKSICTSLLFHQGKKMNE